MSMRPDEWVPERVSPWVGYHPAGEKAEQHNDEPDDANNGMEMLAIMGIVSVIIGLFLMVCLFAGVL